MKFTKLWFQLDDDQLIIKETNNIGNGFFSGNAYASDGTTINTGANALRMYGTWHATHVESGKTVGVKWFGVASFNDDDKIPMITEYWDVNGLAVQLAEE